jgi:hypothetical protein
MAMARLGDHAFNKNYSYKQFAIWQLAGDLMPDSSKENYWQQASIATIRSPRKVGDYEEYRVEYVTDRTNTFGKALLA